MTTTTTAICDDRGDHLDGADYDDSDEADKEIPYTAVAQLRPRPLQQAAKTTQREKWKQVHPPRTPASTPQSTCSLTQLRALCLLSLRTDTARNVLALVETHTPSPSVSIFDNELDVALRPSPRALA